MDVEEVRHVHDVVDDLAAVRRRDVEDVPAPVGVDVGVHDVLELGRQDVVVGRAALGVVPDHQQAVAHDRLVLLGARAQRDPAGVGDRLALAVAAPAPVVERAGDLVALDGALGQVAAHVPAVAVEHVELAVGALPRPRACRRSPRCRAACRRRTASPGPGSASPRAKRSGAVPWSSAARLHRARRSAVRSGGFAGRRVLVMGSSIVLSVGQMASPGPKQEQVIVLRGRKTVLRAAE